VIASVGGLMVGSLAVVRLSIAASSEMMTGFPS
jgi:hypothetical protein